MKIDAAVLRSADGEHHLETVELRDLRADEILVRVVGAGMCHTDVLPRFEATSTLPIIAGHEGAGVVEAVGDDVSGVEAGDHVCLSFDSCGHCRNCRAGAPSYCDEFFARNATGRAIDGSAGAVDVNGEEVLGRWFGQSSFATHAISTSRNTVVVDRDLPLELLGPLGCGVQTGAGSILIALDVQPGSSLVVFGTGAVGLAAVMAGVVAGASIIIAVDLHESRLATAATLGATHTVNGSDEELVEQVREITHGGADCAFDTTGIPHVMRSALNSTRMNGRTGFVGLQTVDLVLDGQALLGKSVMGILEGSADPQTFIPRMIGLWQEGRFPFDAIIETFPLSAINDAERASATGRVVKPVLLPGS